VTGIVPEGTNSHTFEPAPSDARAMAEADVVFMNGLNLEEPTRRLAEANVAEGVEIVELGSMTIDPDEYIFDFSPREGGVPNPLANPLYALATPRSSRTAVPLDPDAADYERTRGVRARLDELDRSCARSRPRSPRRTASSSPTTIRSRTSRVSTGGP
jgi:manganese/iron transport system substrate-binding protein